MCQYKEGKIVDSLRKPQQKNAPRRNEDSTLTIDEQKNKGKRDEVLCMRTTVSPLYVYTENSCNK